MAGQTSKQTASKSRNRINRDRKRENRVSERMPAASSLAAKADNYYHQRPYTPHNFHDDPAIVYGVKTDAPPVADRLNFNQGPPVATAPPPVQAKLKIGKPGDKFEQEADAIADQVTKGEEKTSTADADSAPTADPLISPKPDMGANFAGNYYIARPWSPGNFHRETGNPTAPPPLEAKTKRPGSLEAEPETSGPDVLQQKPAIIPPGDSAGIAPSTLQPKEEEAAPAIQEKAAEPAVAPPVPEPVQAPAKAEPTQSEEDPGKAATSGGEAPPADPAAFGNAGILRMKGGETQGTAGLESQLNNSKGGGSPLPDETRSKMEDGIGADFSGVRVHNDENAAAMNQGLGAQAFTHGSDIYFNEGKYAPGTEQGDHLLAHELTHTVQQGAAPAVQQKAEPETQAVEPVAQRQTEPTIQRSVISEIVDAAESLGINVSRIARNIPGYSLFLYIIGYDILRDRTVERNFRNLLRGVLELVPVLGALLYDKLAEYGVFDKAEEWISSNLSRMNVTKSRLLGAASDAWDRMSWTEGVSGNLAILWDEFEPIYDDIVDFASSAADSLLGILKEALIKPLVGYLSENSPAYVLATKVIGSKFPLEDPVEATTVEILEDFLKLIGKETELEQMKEKGVLQETADWIDTQLGTFFSLLGRFKGIVSRVWDAFSLETLRDIPGVFTGIWNEFKTLLQDFFDFALTVAAKVLELVKKALLSFLASFANDVPGFHLMTVILGKNPFTGEVVLRTTENLIRGFMGLVPGGEAKFQELKETGVVPKAANKIDALVAKLGISWDMIVATFMGIWDSLSIDDLVDPVGAFQRIVDAFGEPVARIFTFVVEVVKILVELILAIMNFPTELIGQLISNVMAAFGEIKKDPVGFLMNLLKAVKLGFEQFFSNFLSHLMKGLQTWLFGQLGEAGITMPPDLSFKSILGMTMEILGITLDNVLERLALKIGAEKVEKIRNGLDKLTGIWTFVKDVIERGPIAIWEYVQEKISDLWNMIVDGIKNWIMEKIITAVVTKLLSMLDPTGIMAVVNSFIAFFNAVQSFIEKLREMLEIMNTFVMGVLDIARGNVKPAADYLEKALSDGIPVAIAFLANQVGLGKLGEKIQEMVEMARAKINEGIDWLIDKAMQGMQGLMRMLGMGGGEEEDNPGPDERTAEQKEEAVKDATKEAEDYYEANENDPQVLEAKFPDIKRKHQLKEIRLETEGETLNVIAEINPTKKEPLAKPTFPNDPAGIRAELLKIKNAPEFSGKTFKVTELKNYVVAHYKIAPTTFSNKRMPKIWALDPAVIFSSESENEGIDTMKDLSFDPTLVSGPRRISSVRGNRTTFGYGQLRKDSRKGREIMKLGLLREAQYGYTPDKENDRTYLMTEARYYDSKNGLGPLRWDQCDMGHGSVKANEHWQSGGGHGSKTAAGHTQTFDDNVEWNETIENYHGPEEYHKNRADNSGTYMTPGPPNNPDSHPMWWDPDSEGYRG